MSKYMPLADFLKAQLEGRVSLTFAFIDDLVGGLPPTARNHDAWWANSRTNDKHRWGHLWIDAGWECKSIDREAETVVFERFGRESVVCPSRFWWVNHKQTHRDEYAGGYIWSPKATRVGSTKETYKNLTKVCVGDRIISFADGVVKSIGVVTRGCAEAPIPQTHSEAAKYWGRLGWEVLVEWLTLPTWVKPKKFIDRIAPLLPTKHSPLQSNGNGLQGCYLASISTELGELMIDLAVEVDRTASQVVRELQIEAKEAIETEGLAASNLCETEKEQLTRARIGQGTFRLQVAKVEKQCRLTGVDNLAFLVASHIKPWRDCSNVERLCGDNGLLLSPHVDKLFDRGWISFTDEGAVLIAPGADSVVAAWCLPTQALGGKFNSLQKSFLEYHRNHVYQGAPESQT